MKKIALLLVILSSLIGQVDYNSQIQPIFNNNCTSCHMYGNASGGSTLTSYSGVMTNSNSGASVVPGDHANSLLWQRVNNGSMPPQNNPDLSADQINLIAQWINQGASLQLSEEINISPQEYTLHQNYPNPFNPNTSMNFDLPKDGLVNITIYDMMGRIVKTLVNGSQTAGFKNIQWNATDNLGKAVPAGVYLYSIETKDFTKSKKMILLK